MNTIKKILYITICLSILPLQALAVTKAQVAQHLMNLINDTRRNPLAMTYKCDIDSTTVKEGLGQNAWILGLKNGIPPLAWNDKLADSASEHTKDMDENNFYDYVSFDGISIEARIAAAGYTSVKTGSLLGLLDLNWYADPIEAAEIIFENLLKKAVTSGFNTNGNFLNPNFTEIGISFVAATIGSLNGYLMAADMAKPENKRVYLIGRCYTNDVTERVSSTADQNLGINLKTFPLDAETGMDEESLLPLADYQLPLGGFQIELPKYYRMEILTQNGDILYETNKQKIAIAPSRNQLLDLNVIPAPYVE